MTSSPYRSRMPQALQKRCVLKWDLSMKVILHCVHWGEAVPSIGCSQEIGGGVLYVRTHPTYTHKLETGDLKTRTIW